MPSIRSSLPAREIRVALADARSLTWLPVQLNRKPLART